MRSRSTRLKSVALKLVFARKSDQVHNFAKVTVDMQIYSITLSPYQWFRKHDSVTDNFEQLMVPTPQSTSDNRWQRAPAKSPSHICLQPPSPANAEPRKVFTSRKHSEEGCSSFSRKFGKDEHTDACLPPTDAHLLATEFDHSINRIWEPHLVSHFDIKTDP